MARHHGILLVVNAVCFICACANDWDVNLTTSEVCCARHKKLVHIGFDINGDDYYVDIGQCKHRCKTNDHTEPQEPHHPCDPGYSCHPTSHRLESHLILEGDKQIATISSCACVEKPDNCQREPKFLRLFDDSPFQVDVDVGECRGACPSGAVCVEVIEECACTPQCYRMHRTSVYFDVSWNATDANATEQNPITKEIDVGRCVGVCTSDQGHLCVVRDPKDPSKCLMSLTEKDSSCIPSSYTTHRLRNGRVVLAVSDCGC